MFGDERLPARFWDKVSPEPNTGCWLWTASGKLGYGAFRFDGRQRQAHRLAYRKLVGEFDTALVCDHLCRTPACVNPAHIEPVTQAENVRRGDSGKEQRERTHCPSGHEYAGENLIVAKSGRRHCRECSRASWREYKRRVRAKAGAA